MIASAPTPKIDLSPNLLSRFHHTRSGVFLVFVSILIMWLVRRRRKPNLRFGDGPRSLEMGPRMGGGEGLRGAEDSVQRPVGKVVRRDEWRGGRGRT